MYGVMRVSRWVNYAMVYLGSLLMVYNIYCFIRYAWFIRGLKTQERGAYILNIPIVMLICFLLGYLAVGLFGAPDLIVSGILFGGSVFVFAIYKLLDGITQRIIASEHLEAELMAAEESNRAKTSFLASMSHEMRTPLNAIIGLDGLVLQDDSLKPQTRERAEQIDLSARHLLEMINDVLDMNHIESRDMQLKAEPFSLRELLSQVNILAQTRCREKGLDYRQTIADDVESVYVGDAMHLRQVLLSLLGNAIKFTPAGGSVGFDARQESRQGDSCVLRFAVADTGEGIDPAFLPKIFEPFTQEDSSATNRFSGSGLGLSIAKRLVEMMDGDIAVTSEKGQGSTFVVTVRLGACRENPNARKDEGAGLLEGRHIMIAEDIDLNADMLADLLELEGMTSERSADGRAALELFKASPPGHFDAILMDLRMPVMDGLDAARAIRALDRQDARDSPIVALSANAFEEDVRHALEAGMNGHLSKPLDSDKLFETLRNLLQ